jgi:ABC-type oligopeptide transport system substrate-binding subunit
VRQSAELDLGPLEVSVGGRKADVGKGKQRALLALLLLRPREAVSTDALIEVLWRDSPPASAMNSVHIYVSRLRKELGEDRLVTRDLARIGIDVVIQELPKSFIFRRASVPGAPHDIMLVGWAPDYFDPGAALSILRGPIPPTANTNYSYFDDPSLSRRLAAADRLSGPSRYTTYDRIARDLARAAPIVAYANDVSGDFFSTRIGCQVYNPVYGIDLALLCVGERGGGEAPTASRGGG